MISDAELSDLQSLAEEDMRDVFTAYAPDGTTVVDGLRVQAYASRGETVGLVQGQSLVAKAPVTRTETIGGVARPVIDSGLRIPLSAPLPTAGDVGVGWEYECIRPHPRSDPSLLGRRYLVVNAPAMSLAAARRLDVVELPQAPDDESSSSSGGEESSSS